MTHPLRELVGKATPGPWEADGSLIWAPDDCAAPKMYGASRNGKAPMADLDDREYACSPNPETDAALIVAMRNSIESLLDEVEGLRAKRDAANEKIGNLVGDVLAAEARAEKLAERLRTLENANDRVCGARPQHIYLAMVDAGMSDALSELDDARQAARRALSSDAGER